MTLNDTWGYKAHDHAWTDPAEAVSLLASCAAKNANLLLNVGPLADGSFPIPAMERLAAVGAWMRDNHTSIQGTQAVDLPSDPPWGEVTCSGSNLHLLVSTHDAVSVSLPCPQDAIVVAVKNTFGDPIAFRSVDGWLIIDLLPAINTMPRRVTILCSRPPIWQPMPSEDPNGLITLLAVRAILDDGSAWNGYLDTGRSAVWQLSCARAGRFLATLGEVELAIGANDLSLTMIATSGPFAGYIPRVRLQRLTG